VVYRHKAASEPLIFNPGVFVRAAAGDIWEATYPVGARYGNWTRTNELSGSSISLGYRKKKLVALPLLSANCGSTYLITCCLAFVKTILIKSLTSRKRVFGPAPKCHLSRFG
jgi:hypothetical protein